MAEPFTFPDGVLAAQTAFLVAEARCAAMVRTHPRPTDVAAGRAQISDEQHAEFAAAMEEQRRLAEQLEAYWASVEPEKRTAGRAALREAAQL
ncbi:MAG: hypothetical protein JWL97_3910 [Gemmatimonadales bacterium]|jgi:hypothetical protein|nr:hypothetical protein [Gemmatimonadales bacterium]